MQFVHTNENYGYLPIDWWLEGEVSPREREKRGEEKIGVWKILHVDSHLCIL